METPSASRPDGAQSSGSQLAAATLDGWFVLHQLYRLDGPLLNRLDTSDKARLLDDLSGRLERWAEPPGGGWSGAYRMVGGGVDLMLVHFRQTLDELIDVGHEASAAPAADLLALDHEYVSVVELGMYGLTAEVAGRVDPGDREPFAAALEEALEAERGKAHVRRRLYPVQPESMPYVCYYPMDKRRDQGRNWYTLSIEKRAEMMRAHGTIGRRFAGQISQVISGSLGLADWEWAVTLWAADPLTFKRIVTEMRYDEASAEYAEFGRFFVGRRMTASDILGWWS